MRKLILIAFIFSLQIMQGQVSAELLWERTFINHISSISHDKIDSNLYVVYGVMHGGSDEKTQISKLSTNSGTSLKTSDYSTTRQVYLSKNGQPKFVLDFGYQYLCGIDSNNLTISNSCIESYGDFNYSSFQIFHSFDLNNIYLAKRYLNLNDSLKCHIFNFDNNTFDDEIILNLEQKQNIQIVNYLRTKNQELSIVLYFAPNSNSYLHLAIFSRDRKLMFNIDSLDIDFNLIDFNLGRINFSISKEENYLYYFKNNILYSLDLKLFEIKTITQSNLPLAKFFIMSNDDKHILINTNDGIYHYDFTNNLFTKLTNERAKSISFTENQYSYYAIIGWDKLRKYRLNFTNSINEEESETNLSISPNPTSDFINIVGIEPETRLELTNIFGETVWSGVGAKQISTQSLPNGTYFLKTTKGSQVKSQKVLVLR